MPTALVTGSASGIGRAAVLRLARGGYDVVVNYSRSRDRAEQTVKDAEAHGVRAFAAAGDVSDDDDARALVHFTTDHFGGLDVLVNNAGTTMDTAPDDLDTTDITSALLTASPLAKCDIVSQRQIRMPTLPQRAQMVPDHV